MKAHEYMSLNEDELKALVAKGDLYAEFQISENEELDFNDPQAAVQLYTKLAAEGLLRAYWSLSYCYEDGHVTGQPEPVKALGYLFFVEKNRGKSDIEADVSADNETITQEIAEKSANLTQQQINEAKAFCDSI
jgi:TPR repeat protein